MPLKVHCLKLYNYLLCTQKGFVRIYVVCCLKMKISKQVTNAGTFRFNKEDHTVGNLFRMQLLRDPSVRFAGYLHPHPLVHFIDLKIQTNNSTVAPVEVLSSAIEDLSNETDHLMQQFSEAMESFQRENQSELGGGKY